MPPWLGECGSQSSFRSFWAHLFIVSSSSLAIIKIFTPPLSMVWKKIPTTFVCELWSAPNSKQICYNNLLIQKIYNRVDLLLLVILHHVNEYMDLTNQDTLGLILMMYVALLLSILERKILLNWCPANFLLALVTLLERPCNDGTYNSSMLITMKTHYLDKGHLVSNDAYICNIQYILGGGGKYFVWHTFWGPYNYIILQIKSLDGMIC